MEYKRFQDTLILRIDPGEEILEALKKVAEKEQIKLAEVSALGAIGEFTTGVFDPEKKQYSSNDFKGHYEIVSLTGTVTEMEGACYLHIHMSAGDGAGHVFGGHLNRAVVSATSEMVIRVIDGHVGRKFDDKIGLNLFEF